MTSILNWRSGVAIAALLSFRLQCGSGPGMGGKTILEGGGPGT